MDERKEEEKERRRLNKQSGTEEKNREQKSREQTIKSSQNEMTDFFDEYQFQSELMNIFWKK